MTQEQSKTLPNSVVVKNAFHQLYGEVATIYDDEKSSNPCAFAEWKNGKWTKHRAKAISDETVKMARAAFPFMQNITDVASRALKEIIATAPATLEEDWNVSTDSIPLADGNWSISFMEKDFGQIIKTPREHMMLDRLPVSKAELESAAKTFQQSKMRKFLLDWLMVQRDGQPNATRYRGLAKLLGQGLAGNPEAVIMLWIGNGKNGKSQLLKALKSAVGPFSTPMNVDDYTISKGAQPHPEGLMCLRTVRFGVVGELESPNTMLSGGRLKTHSGGDAFKARGMRQGSQEMVSNTAFIVFGNHDPRIDDTSGGMERRIKYVAFENIIPDNKLINKNQMLKILETEKHHMLHWMLEGAKEWHKDGLGDLGLIDEDTINYMAEEDVLMDVFDTFLEPCIGGDVTVDELFQAINLARVKVGGITNTRTLAKQLRKRQTAGNFTMSPLGAHGKVKIFDRDFRTGKSPDALQTK